MMRDVFNTQNITYIEKTSKVIYRTGKFQKGENRKNFAIYDSEEFIAAITQHIPKKNSRWPEVMASTRTSREASELKPRCFPAQRAIREQYPMKSRSWICRSINPKMFLRSHGEIVLSLTWRDCIKRYGNQIRWFVPNASPRWEFYRS